MADEIRIYKHKDGSTTMLNVTALNEFIHELAVEEAIRLLRINANNLNQYAKRANETGSIYLEDIKELQKAQEELWQVMRDILERLSSIK